MVQPISHDCTWHPLAVLLATCNSNFDTVHTVHTVWSLAAGIKGSE